MKNIKNDLIKELFKHRKTLYLILSLKEDENMLDFAPLSSDSSLERNLKLIYKLWEHLLIQKEFKTPSKRSNYVYILTSVYKPLLKSKITNLKLVKAIYEEYKK